MQILEMCENQILYQKAGETCVKLENVEYQLAVNNCITDIQV